MLVAEAAGGAYLALLAFLLCGWMVDDSAAFRMADEDWLVVGARRLSGALLVAAAFAAIARPWHRRWVLTPRSPAWLRVVPLLLAGGIALAGTAGAAMFVVTRPFL